MKNRITAVVVFLIFFSPGCNKDKDNVNPDCTSGTILQTVTDQSALVSLVNGSYYIFPMGTIDSRYVPCSLPEAFKANDLHVTVSGNIRARVSTALEPCCTYWIDITSISKR